MLTAAVGRFHEHVIGVRQDGRVAHDGRTLTADVTGEDDRPLPGTDLDDRGAEDVSRIMHAPGHAVRDRELVTVRDLPHHPERGQHVGLAVERLVDLDQHLGPARAQGGLWVT